jgi:hypothetical protein
MKIAIVGSRDFCTHEEGEHGIVCPLNEAAKDAVYTILSRHQHKDTVVSGGARGVDSWAEAAAKGVGMTVEIYPADWETHGRSAGFKRNEDIIRAADKVYAVWDGASRGTKHSIDLALRHRKDLEVKFIG